MAIARIRLRQLHRILAPVMLLPILLTKNAQSYPLALDMGIREKSMGLKIFCFNPFKRVLVLSLNFSSKPINYILKPKAD